CRITRLQPRSRPRETSEKHWDFPRGLPAIRNLCPVGTSRSCALPLTVLHSLHGPVPAVLVTKAPKYIDRRTHRGSSLFQSCARWRWTRYEQVPPAGSATERSGPAATSGAQPELLEQEHEAQAVADLPVGEAQLVCRVRDVVAAVFDANLRV